MSFKIHEIRYSLSFRFTYDISVASLLESREECYIKVINNHNDKTSYVILHGKIAPVVC